MHTAYCNIDVIDAVDNYNSQWITFILNTNVLMSSNVKLLQKQIQILLAPRVRKYSAFKFINAS